MNFKDISVESKEVGKLVGIAKRSFTMAKTRTVKIIVDQIKDYENEYFSGDEELAKLVKAKQELKKETDNKTRAIDAAIVGRINTTLKTKRGYDAEELYDKRQGALLELLKDASCVVSQLTNPTVKPSEEFLNGLKERLGNMITELEEGAE